MAQLNTIVVMDGESVPVEHTYKPIGKPSGSDWDYFVERLSDGRPDLQNELRLRTRQPSNKGQPYRTDITTIDVETDTVEGEEVIVSQGRIDLTATLARNGSKQARTNMRVKLANALLNDPILIAAWDDLENTY